MEGEGESTAVGVVVSNSGSALLVA